MENDNQSTVLIVDDIPENLAILTEILNEDYHVRVAKEGRKALQICGGENPPDIILLDIVMPNLNGYQVLQRLSKSPRTREIPVIFVTSKGESEEEYLGLSLGAVDYLVKPVNPSIVRARVATHLELRRSRMIIAEEKDLLEDRVKERTRDLMVTQRVFMTGITNLAETRDNETGGHIRRTEQYVGIIAKHVFEKSNYSLEDIELIIRSAPLHDIGKVSIPDCILLKPGKLTGEEFEIMKEHTEAGYRALQQAEEIEGTTPFLKFAKEICRTHHERWDGTGYPIGLKGADIPLSGRIMALADVYDALISERVYKEPLSHSQARDIILGQSGKQFDPWVTEAFDIHHEEFRGTALAYADTDAERKALAV